MTDPGRIRLVEREAGGTQGGKFLRLELIRIGQRLLLPEPDIRRLLPGRGVFPQIEKLPESVFQRRFGRFR